MRNWIGILVPLSLMTGAHAQPYEGRGYAIFPCETYVVAYHAPHGCHGPRYVRYETHSYYCAPRYVAYGPGYGRGHIAPRYHYYPSRVHTVYGAPSASPPRAYDAIVGGSSADRTESEAWELLGGGDAREAIGTFTRAATQRQNEAGPKIGYALAALELGDVTTGVWAMRRAFRFDAPGARYLPLDEGLVRLIDRHRRSFEYESRLEPDERWFMVAALRYIAHEDDAAREAVAWAQSGGDRSYELRRLAGELDREPSSATAQK